MRGDRKILTSILLGVILGLLVREPIFKILSFDPYEYCEHHGITYSDINELFDDTKRDGYRLNGYDYAYICNINGLHVDKLAESNITFYGVTRGNVKEIPPEISKLIYLERLQVHDQKIITLPKEIGSLPKLITLKLGGNNLKTLPPEIGNLSNLEVLHLYDNQLTSLPIEIGNLTKLTVLDVRFNFLSALPTEIENLASSLERLYLGGNLIKEADIKNLKVKLPNTKIFY